MVSYYEAKQKCKINTSVIQKWQVLAFSQDCLLCGICLFLTCLKSSISEVSHTTGQNTACDFIATWILPLIRTIERENISTSDFNFRFKFPASAAVRSLVLRPARRPRLPCRAGSDLSYWGENFPNPRIYQIFLRVRVTRITTLL